MNLEYVVQTPYESGLLEQIRDTAARWGSRLLMGQAVVRQQEVAHKVETYRAERALAFLETVPPMRDLTKEAVHITPLPEDFCDPDEDDWDAPDSYDVRLYGALPRLLTYVRPENTPGMVNTAHEVGLGSQMARCTQCPATVYPAEDAYDIVAWQKPEDVTHISYNHTTLDPFPEVVLASELRGEVRSLRISKEDEHVMRTHPLSARAQTDQVIEFAEAFEKWNEVNAI